jgi:hypothetical protein
VLAEQLAAGAAVQDAPAPVEEAVAVAEPVVSDTPVEVPAPDAVAEEKPAETAEPDFDLEPETIVTPEALQQMITENADFAKLLQDDPKLNGRLHKTAREAAELKPYREIFPDLESAKSAVGAAAEWNDVRETFMGSTTREGTLKTLARLTELSYERDDTGNVLYKDDQPVIGEDLHGFLDNVWAIEMEDRKSDIQKRLDANQYHVGVKTDEERDAAIRLDQGRLALIDDLLGQVVEAPETQDMTPAQQRRQQEQDARDKEWQQKQQGEKVGERQKFETTMQTAAQDRLNGEIAKIMASVEKQGGVVSPYLKNILPKAIASKVIGKILANPTLQAQMHNLQRLPMGDDARTRRVAAIDRAYQTYLGGVAREELREAGVQIANASAAKRAKIDGQIDNTRKTEPTRGSTGAVTAGRTPMTADAAYETAKGEWIKANPGRRFDKSAEGNILQRVVNLQLQ